MEKELDEDDEEEDSFENLEEVSPIDPSATVNSFLGTDFERSQVYLQACPESLTDLSDGIRVPPVVVFLAFRGNLIIPFLWFTFPLLCLPITIGWLIAIQTLAYRESCHACLVSNCIEVIDKEWGH